LKNVIIADDNPFVLKSLNSLFLEIDHFDNILTAKSGSELIRKHKRHKPDLLVIDIVMPGMSGFDVVNEIRLFDKKVKIILICNFSYSEVIIKSVLVGADCFLLKKEIVKNLNQALKTLRKEKLFFNENIITKAKNIKGSYFTGLEVHEIKKKLSKKEFEIFCAIGKTPNCGEAAEKLNISKKTAYNHLEKMKRKLNLNAKNELYKIAVIYLYLNIKLNIIIQVKHG